MYYKLVCLMLAVIKTKQLIHLYQKISRSLVRGTKSRLVFHAIHIPRQNDFVSLLYMYVSINIILIPITSKLFIFYIFVFNNNSFNISKNDVYNDICTFAYMSFGVTACVGAIAHPMAHQVVAWTLVARAIASMHCQGNFSTEFVYLLHCLSLLINDS